MDYEKKYKDAMLVEQNAIIETMKAKVDLEKFICSYVKWNNIQDALKDQGLKCWNGEIVEIPQESEDERIKKEILDLVSISGNGNQFEEIKDWLEKQGKSKWNENDEHHLRMCLECVEECAFQDREDFSKTTDWLKSLKQRMEQ